MTTLQIIILTILAQQVVCAIVYFASGEKEELTAIVSFGFMYVIIAGIASVIQLVVLHYYRKNYEYCQFYGKIKEGEHIVHSWISNYYVQKNILEKFHSVVNEDDDITQSYSVRIIRPNKPFKSIPPKSERITNSHLENKKSVYGMSYQYFQNFLK